MVDQRMENMTTDIISQILPSIGYILLLVILALLWRKAYLQSESRQFWLLLALAWTMNLFGNIAWIVHDLVTGTPLDTLSVVDLFFVLHYVFVGCALWLFPTPLPRRTWFWIGGIMLAVIVVDRVVYFIPATTLRREDWIDFLSLVMYTLLDAGIIVLAWLRVRATRGSVWGRYALLLFFVMASYGIANTINLTEYIFSLTSGGVLQNVFWILSDVLLLVMILGVDLQMEKQKLAEG